MKKIFFAAFGMLLLICAYAIVLMLILEAWLVLLKPLNLIGGATATFWTAMSAVATGCTGIVAVWLGLQQQRWRRQDELSKAKVVAAGIAPRLGHIIDALEVLETKLPFREKLRDEQHASEIRQLLQDTTLHMTIEEMASMVPLPDLVAQKTSQATALIARVGQRVNWTLAQLEKPEVRNNPFIDADAKNWASQANEARQLLAEVKSTCERMGRIAVTDSRKTRVLNFLSGLNK